MRFHKTTVFLAAFVCTVFSSCSKNMEVKSFTAMNTDMTVKSYSPCQDHNPILLEIDLN